MVGDVGGAADLRLVAGDEHAVLGADEVGLDVVGAELGGEAVGRERVLGAVAGGAAVADDERPRMVVVAVRMGRRRRGQREQEEEGGEEQAEGSHGPDHSTGCAKSRVVKSQDAHKRER